MTTMSPSDTTLDIVLGALAIFKVAFLAWSTRRR